VKKIENFDILQGTICSEKKSSVSMLEKKIPLEGEPIFSQTYDRKILAVCLGQRSLNWHVYVMLIIVLKINLIFPLYAIAILRLPENGLLRIELSIKTNVTYTIQKLLNLNFFKWNYSYINNNK